MTEDRPAGAVIFDFNGTLFFDDSFHEKAWTAACKELHGGIKKVAEMTREEQRKYSARKDAIYREICKQNPEQVHLAAGAEELFAALKKQGIPFTLATASIAENMDFYFESFPLKDWFDRKQCVYDDGNYKSKGAMHLEAARRLGVPFENCLVVEDNPRAASEARANGAGKIIGIGSGRKRIRLLEAGVDCCISDFTEADLFFSIPAISAELFRL